MLCVKDQMIDVLANVLPIADVPEYLIHKYLPGDACLDHCDTIHLIFTKKYSKNECTYLDESCTILHSFDDQPARINRYAEYYKNGKLHRDKDQPAIVIDIDHREWWKHGNLHRDGDEPAVIHSSGSKEWYKNGNLHRDGDEPAIIHSSGTKEYWKHGKRHRDGDEPAVIYSGGNKEYEYWKHGRYIYSSYRTKWEWNGVSYRREKGTNNRSKKRRKI